METALHYVVGHLRSHERPYKANTSNGWLSLELPLYYYSCASDFMVKDKIKVKAYRSHRGRPNPNPSESIRIGASDLILFIYKVLGLFQHVSFGCYAVGCYIGILFRPECSASV